MRQFIPFEDDWDLLKTLSPDDLIPYRVGLLAAQDAPNRSASVAVDTPLDRVEAGARKPSFYPVSREDWSSQRKM